MKEWDTAQTAEREGNLYPVNRQVPLWDVNEEYSHYPTSDSKVWVLQQRCFLCSHGRDGFASLPIDSWGHSRNGPVLWLLNWHPENLLGGPKGLRPSAPCDPCRAAYQENSLPLLASSEVAAERKQPAEHGLAAPTVEVSKKPCRMGHRWPHFRWL